VTVAKEKDKPPVKGHLLCANLEDVKAQSGHPEDAKVQSGHPKGAKDLSILCSSLIVAVLRNQKGVEMHLLLQPSAQGNR